MRIALAGAALALLVSCTGPQSDSSSPPAQSSSATTAAPEGVFFPRLTGEPPRYGAALIEGMLVEAGGCLQLEDLYFSAEFAPPSRREVVLPLWPEGAEATRTGDGAINIQAPELPQAMSGKRADLGGGFTSLKEAEQMIGEPIPTGCRVGHYWVATSVHS